MEAYGLQDWVPSHEDIQASPLSPRPFVYGPASSNPSPPYHRPQAWWQQLQQECTNQPRHFPPNSADHQWQQDPPYQHPFSQANQHLQHATIQQPHLHHQPCSTPEHRQQPYQHERSHPQQAGAVQALKQAATMTEFSSPEICNPLASTSFVLESVQDFACAPPRLPPCAAQPSFPSQLRRLFCNGLPFSWNLRMVGKLCHCLVGGMLCLQCIVRWKWAIWH